MDRMGKLGTRKEGSQNVNDWLKSAVIYQIFIGRLSTDDSKKDKEFHKIKDC